jgi:hypothetical protein
MKNNASKSKPKPTAGPVENTQPGVAVTQPQCPEPEAFLTEAKSETKRKLLSDHLVTIQTLRDEKRFTFRDIADWFIKRGFETDHSAVYRAYLTSIPEENRDPREDWSDADLPD